MAIFRHSIPVAQVQDDFSDEFVRQNPSGSTPRAEVAAFRQDLDTNYHQGGSNVRRSRSSAPVVEKSHTVSILRKPYSDIREKYSLGPELGRGQFGIIRVCVERSTGTAWACKCISKSRLTSTQDVIDVQREVKAMSMVSGHPAIIGLKETIEDNRRVYLIMELCEGGELFERITNKERYSEKDAAQVFRTLASVVEHCHSRGVMHRDLKPENILLVSEESDIDIKVVDFGLAVFVDRGTRLDAMAGSAYYIAPEVLANNYSLEADIWSLGIILYILLCGMPPFWHDEEEGIFEAIRAGKYDLSKGVWRKVSAEAKDLIRRILVQNPQQRLNIYQIFEHPWLKQHCKSEDLQQAPLAQPVRPAHDASFLPPLLTSVGPGVRPVPVNEMASRFKRSNSGDSLASSNFSEFSPRGSRKFSPFDHSSSFSGSLSGILKYTSAADASRKSPGGRVSSGELPPIFHGRSTFSNSSLSGEFSGPQSSKFSGDFTQQRSGEFVGLRSPQQQQPGGSNLSKTNSLGSGSKYATRKSASEIPRLVEAGVKLPATRQRSPQEIKAGIGSSRPRTDAKERTRSLSFGKALEAGSAGEGKGSEVEGVSDGIGGKGRFWKLIPLASTKR